MIPVGDRSSGHRPCPCKCHVAIVGRIWCQGKQGKARQRKGFKTCGHQLSPSVENNRAPRDSSNLNIKGNT